jgi:hypothetical protein
VKEVQPPALPDADAATFLACVATILELPVAALPTPRDGEDPATGWTVSRWLGGLGVALAPLANVTEFSWPGPWIARIRRPDAPDRRSVVMYGVPSGVVFDPGGDGKIQHDWIEDGFLIAAGDIALALPPRLDAPLRPGLVEELWVAPQAGVPGETRESITALPGRGLEGDRHVTGKGTFPSGVAGSALTLIEAEVCESFDPPLAANEHRRNVVTRGIELGRLVGAEFTIGSVDCRGMRLCEPCTVVERYAGRPVLRALVHRGGLRADILSEGEIRVGDELRALASADVPGQDALNH